MQSDNRVFDDFVKFVNGAAGTVAGMAREGESAARERFKGFVGGLDFVARDEFDAVKAMAAAARDENEALQSRIAILEARMGVTPDVTAKPAAAKKVRTKKGDAEPGL